MVYVIIKSRGEGNASKNERMVKMKQSEIIERCRRKIERNAYIGTVQEVLGKMGIDSSMMEYESNVAYGKAFAAQEIYNEITGDYKTSTAIFEEMQAMAYDDVKEKNGDIEKLLDMAGYDGSEYLKYLEKHCLIN